MKTQLIDFITKKISKDLKAEKSILQCILGISLDLNIPNTLIINWIDDAKNDKIFKTLDFINGGNWQENVINKDYLPFMCELFGCRPVGLGTPNAACGEGELMLILSSTKINRPTKNDIKIGDEVFNLKNDTPRFFGEISGKKLNKKLLEVCDRLGFTPNYYKSVKSVQLVNKNYVENHWNKQFVESEISTVKELLITFLVNLFPEKKVSDTSINHIISKVLIEKSLIWDLWIKELIIFLYTYGDEKKENLVLMNVDGVVNKIPTNLSDFTNLVRKNIIVFTLDYFRMNQNNKVGVYVKFVN